jgi:TolB-like protein
MLTIVLVGAAAPVSAQPLKVAILPFQMNAEKDLTFLRDGIVDMLASRLAWEDKVTVINEEQTASVMESVQGFKDESQALLVGGKLGADYVLFGSVTVFGDSVSIDAKMVDVTGKNEPFVFFNQSQGMGTVIPKINQFATDINETVFGRTAGTRVVAVPPTQVQPAQTQTVPVPPAPETDRRTHPDKLLQEGFGPEDQQANLQGAPLAAAPGAGAATVQTSDQFWTSQRFKLRLNGIAIGDVDNDGRQEMVLMDPQTVEIYRFENNRLVKVFQLADENFRRFIAVDIADINGNGTPEIFLTALTIQLNKLDSVVYEFDGQRYKTVVDKSPWYFRVLDLPGRGKVLFGQGQRIGGPDPFSSPIVELAWKGSDYDVVDQVLASGRANLLGFAYGDVMNDGDPISVAYDTEEKLRIMRPSGEVVWQGADHFGGRNTHFLLPVVAFGEEEQKFFYNTRIVLADLNRDGKKEVITLQNQELAGRLFEQFRKFQKGQIVGLAWDGLGLADLWRTREVTGQLDDFAIGDFDNDGADEIVATVIISQGSIVGTTPKSAVIAYELK